MFRRIGLLFICIALTPSAPQGSQLATGIAGVVAPDVEVELVQEGFVFTEGPVGTADGGLYFTDLRSMPSRIYRLDPNPTGLPCLDTQTHASVI